MRFWVPKAKVERQVKQEPVRRRNGAETSQSEHKVDPVGQLSNNSLVGQSFTKSESNAGSKRQRIEEISDDNDQPLDMFFVGQV